MNNFEYLYEDYEKNTKSNIIDSRDFKKWFGDWSNDTEHASKVVNSNGVPLIVFHGSTKKGIRVFNSDFTFFSDNYEASLEYSRDDEGNSYYDGTVYECYLNMRNPYIIECDGDIMWDTIPYEGKEITTDDLAEIIKFKGKHDGIILKDIVEPLYEYPITDYIVFKPNQIKSVMNKGNFSKESNDIYD